MADKQQELLIGAGEGNLEKVRAALESGVSPNIRSDWDESTPLSRAALGKHVAVVEYLLANGADVRSDAYKTVDLGDPDAFKERVTEGIGGLMNVLGDAMRTEQEKHASAPAKAAAAEVAPLTSFDDPPVGDGEFDGVDDDEEDYPDSALAAAAQGGSVEIMKLLVAKGAPVHKLDGLGTLPIAAAARAGQLEACAWLLENGASWKPNLISTPLSAAAASGNVELVKLFLGDGADVNYAEPDDHMTALHEASTVEVAQLLLDAGADANADAEGELPINSAAYAGNTTLVEFLAQHTRDSEAIAYAREELGNLEGAGNAETQSLVDAACFARIEVFRKALAKAGVDVNGRDGDGARTPLVMAAFHLRPLVVHALLEAGADPNVADGRSGETALHCVASEFSRDPSKALSIADGLIRAGGKLDAKESDGDTPLHQSLGSPRLLELFLEHGASTDVTNAAGHTPLALVQSWLKEHDTAEAQAAEAQPEEASKGLFGKVKSLLGGGKSKKSDGGLQGFFAQMEASANEMAKIQMEAYQESAAILERHSAS